MIALTSAEREAARRERRRAAIASRATMSPLGPLDDGMRIATWNVNSVRARLPALERFVVRARPDVLCLQETKAAATSADAAALVDRLGYEAVHVGAGQYNGVAIWSRHPITDVVGSGGFGDEHLDREPRLISALIGTDPPTRVASVYVPHGREVGHWHYEFKLAFLSSFATQVRRWLATGDHLVVGGDVNVAPTNSDIFHPDAFVGLTHVTDEERAALGVVLAGLVDVDAAVWGAAARRFTWWNHGRSYGSNLGMRIDLLASDLSLADRVRTTWIDHRERGGERPSDHAALLADFAPAGA